MHNKTVQRIFNKFFLGLWFSGVATLNEAWCKTSRCGADSVSFLQLFFIYGKRVCKNEKTGVEFTRFDCRDTNAESDFAFVDIREYNRRVYA